MSAGADIAVGVWGAARAAMQAFLGAPADGAPVGYGEIQQILA